MDALITAGYKMLTVSQLMARMKQPAEPLSELLALTFDDGLVEHASRVLPILTERKIAATFYVLTGRSGEAPNMGSREGRHLTREEISDLADVGMEVGSHSRSHPVL